MARRVTSAPGTVQKKQQMHFVCVCVCVLRCVQSPISPQLSGFLTSQAAMWMDGECQILLSSSTSAGSLCFGPWHDRSSGCCFLSISLARPRSARLTLPQGPRETLIQWLCGWWRHSRCNAVKAGWPTARSSPSWSHSISLFHSFCLCLIAWQQIKTNHPWISPNRLAFAFIKTLWPEICSVTQPHFFPPKKWELTSCDVLLLHLQFFSYS